MNENPLFPQTLLAALGPLAPLYRDPQVIAIMVDAPERVWIETSNDGQVLDAGVHFASREALQDVVDALLSVAQVQLAPGQVIVDTRLVDGTRMLAVLPATAVNGPYLVIVKLPSSWITWEMLFEHGSISQAAFESLKSAVLARRSILVSGGYSSGKTTLMNLIAELAPQDQRLVVVQTDFDLRVRHPRAVFLTAGEATGPDLSELISTASKLRGGWLVIGELLGPEALRVLEILSRGHPGLTTIHANSPEDALARLEMMCLKANLGLGLSEIRSLIASALQVIVHQELLPSATPDGPRQRKVLQVVELRGVENGRYLLQPRYRYNFEAGRLEEIG